MTKAIWIGVFLGIVIVAPTCAFGQDAKLELRYSNAFDPCIANRNGVPDDVPAAIRDGISECILAETNRWDTRLNAAYNRIMSSQGLSQEARIDIRDAQRAWLAFYERRCRSEANISMAIGSANRNLYLKCRLDMMAQRAVELELSFKYSVASPP
jgi:uncharacterized protein YecT (DUF1311 family)